MTKKHSLSVVVAALAFSFPAFAGMGTSLMQSAPVLNPGEFEAKIQNDVIFNRGGGFNISPHLRTGVIEHFVDVEAFFGTGTTDFQFGGLAKYNFLPDLPGQAGLSFLGGLSYIRDDDNNSPDIKVNRALLTTGILASKAFRADFGNVEPYGALQVEVLMGQGSGVPINLLAGSRWQPHAAQPWIFYSELSINLRRSVWGFAFGAGYPF